VRGTCVRGGTSRVAACGLRCGRVANHRQEASYILTSITAYPQGSRPRCLCRFFFCTVLISFLLIAVILLNLALVRVLCHAHQLGLVIPVSSGYNRQISSLEVITAQYAFVVIYGGTRLTQRASSRQLSPRASACCQTGSKSI
jgi:hypothetical protein